MASTDSSTLGPSAPATLLEASEQNPDAILNLDPLPGYVWLDAPGKVLHVPTDALEFQERPD